MSSVYDQRPQLVFWETTKACELSCIHCRAVSQSKPSPDEMSLDDSLEFISSLKSFGNSPVLILTGGNVMLRNNIGEIVESIGTSSIPAAASPAVSDSLTPESTQRMISGGIHSFSISLDGKKAFHDMVRGSGSYFRTIDAADMLKQKEARLQINTLVTADNIYDLPFILKWLIENGIKVWEIFFLVRTGRGIDLQDLNKKEYEGVCMFLVFASGYGINIRTVEGPYFRVLAKRHNDGIMEDANPIFEKMRNIAESIIASPRETDYKIPVAGTSDGNGIIFVGHDGSVYPSGFLPIKVGSILEKPISEIYRESDLLLSLRNRKNLAGKCGSCEYMEVCGGSRARAFYYTGSVLGEDPLCPRVI